MRTLAYGSLAFATLATVFGLLSVGLSGCSDPGSTQPVIVEGQVTFQGRPLAGGMLVFVPNQERGCNGQMSTANVADDGTYRIGAEGTGLVPGWYRVAIADAAPGSAHTFTFAEFPTQLLRPDQSGIERQILPGKTNSMSFHIEVTE